MPLGNRGHIGYKKENTWGERDTGDNNGFFPFVSEGLTRDIEDVLSARMRGILDEPKSYQGEKAFGGPLVVEVHPVSIGHILRSALGAPTGGNLVVTSETELENCDDVWEYHEDVIGSIDGIDKKKGTHSVKVIVPAGVPAPTVLAYEDLPATINMNAVTAIKFWIKTSIDLANVADLEILLSEATGGGFALEWKGNVGLLTANEWKEVTVDCDLSGDNYDAVQCVGLRLGADLAEFVVRIDDIRMIVAGSADVARKHIFTPMQSLDEEFGGGAKYCPLYPYTLEVFRDEGKAYEFLGCVVNTLAFSFSTTDKILKATLGIIAKNAGYVNKTGLGLEATTPFVWKNSKIYLGGVDEGNRYNDLESFSLNWDNKCVAKYALNNTAIPRKIIRTGYREIPISFTVDFTDKTEYDHFLDGTERQMRILFEGEKCGADAANTPYSLQFDIPLLRYLAWPINIGGPGRLSVAVTGKAKYDATYALLINLVNDQTHTIYEAA